MSRPITDHSRAAVLAAVEVHGLGPVLHEIAAEAERQLRAHEGAEPGTVAGAERDALAQITVNLNMAAGEAAGAGL